jgi:CoA:oxalate CoA-transferase
VSIEQQGPLRGVTILDFTRALAGPYATMLLGGLGAKVIRVEPPGGYGRENAPFLGSHGPSLSRQTADDISLGHLIRNRGKQAITLNLKSPDARRVFTDLVQHVDVVVENFTRGTAERLGVGYTTAAAVKPDIIYCSISGFGQQGAPGGGKAMDGIIQALSGVMMTSGNPDDPPTRIGVPFADLSAPLFAVIGIISALYHRQQSGQGQYIDVSMLGAMTALQAVEPFEILEQLGVPMRTGPSVPRLSPFGVYPASDGHDVICCSGDRNFSLLAEVMETPALATDARFATQAARLRHYEALDAEVSRWSSTLTAGEVVRRLDRVGIAAAEVRGPGAAVRDERVLARGEVVRLRHDATGAATDVFGPGIPIVFSRTKASVADRSAEVGEHNDETYRALLGYSDEQLQRLRDAGAI